MSFFKDAITELWVIKGRKNGKWFTTKNKRWQKVISNIRPNSRKRFRKTLKEMSEVLGYPVSFLTRLLKYERIEEYGNNIRKDKRINR